MSGFYDNLCNMLIRPARQTYSDYDLGTPPTTQDPQPSAHSHYDTTSPSSLRNTSPSKPVSTNKETPFTMPASSTSTA